MARELSKEEQAVRESVAKMSTGKKVAYYLDTYKIHILVAVAVTALLVSILHGVLTTAESVFFVGVLNESNFEREYFEESLSEALGLGKKETICVYDQVGTTEFYTNGYYNLLYIYIMADEMTVAFTDWEGAQGIADQGAVTKAEDWMTEDLMSIWQDRIMDIGVGVDQTDDFEPIYEDYPVVVDIAGTKVMEKLGLDQDTHYMIGVCTYNYQDKMARFSEYLYDIEMGE